MTSWRKMLTGPEEQWMWIWQKQRATEIEDLISMHSYEPLLFPAKLELRFCSLTEGWVRIGRLNHKNYYIEDLLPLKFKDRTRVTTPKDGTGCIIMDGYREAREGGLDVKGREGILAKFYFIFLQYLKLYPTPDRPEDWANYLVT
jgi:hypothetical protein